MKIYYEVEGKGPPLILAHGATLNLDTWRKRGYANVLSNEFKLVLFDARGHGQSDKPHEPHAYGLNMADDVVAVLDDAKISQAHYFGGSMGSKVGFWLATHHSKRFISFILHGMSPYYSDAAVKQFQASIEIRRSFLADPEAFFRQREKDLGRLLTNEERDVFLTNDSEALIAMQTSFCNTPSLTDRELSFISVPCLLFCGDLDQYHAGAEEAAKHIQHSTFVSFPGLNHGQALSRSDLVLPIVKKFLAEVNA